MERVFERERGGAKVCVYMLRIINWSRNMTLYTLIVILNRIYLLLLANRCCKSSSCLLQKKQNTKRLTHNTLLQ